MDRLSGRPRPPGPLDGGTADDPTPPMARLRSGPEPPGIEIPRSRFDPGWSGARALMLVAVIAAVVAVGYLWLARPRPQPVAPVAMTASPMVSLSPAASLRASTSPAASQAGGTVVVHVLGKVRHPGVISLPGGARVAEAIKAAGGVRPGTGTGSLNLARKVVDGEQIPVGIRPPPGTVQPPGAGAGCRVSGPGRRCGHARGPQQRERRTARPAPRGRSRPRPAHRRLPNPARRLPLRRPTPGGQRHRQPPLCRPEVHGAGMTGPRTSDHDHDHDPGHDLRLIGPASAVWLAAAAAIGAGAAVAFAIAAAGAIAAVLLLFARRPVRLQRRPSRQGPHHPPPPESDRPEPGPPEPGPPERHAPESALPEQGQGGSSRVQTSRGAPSRVSVNRDTRARDRRGLVTGAKGAGVGGPRRRGSCSGRSSPARRRRRRGWGSVPPPWSRGRSVSSLVPGIARRPRPSSRGIPRRSGDGRDR